MLITIQSFGEPQVEILFLFFTGVFGDVQLEPVSSNETNKYQQDKSLLTGTAIPRFTGRR